METISNDRVRLSVVEAQTLAEETMRRIGYDTEEARIIADHCVDAALCGYEYSGLPKLLNVVEHRQLRQPRRPMRPIRETPLSVLERDPYVSRGGHKLAAALDAFGGLGTIRRCAPSSRSSPTSVRPRPPSAAA